MSKSGIIQNQIIDDLRVELENVDEYYNEGVIWYSEKLDMMKALIDTTAKELEANNVDFLNA